MRRLDYVYDKLLKEKIEDLKTDLAGSSAKDYAGYQYLCGQIHGIRFAMESLIELRERSGVEEDQDS